MPLSHILILGAGPAGLAAALAISQLGAADPAQPLRITVLELRPEVATIGGSINMTPLGMRYLDRLGVGPRLRPRGIPVRAIDMLSLRTGGSLGRIWPNVDAVRVKRFDLVAAMLETARSSENAERITVRYGVRVSGIREEGSTDGPDGKVVLTLDNGEEMHGDVLLGCDGLHSITRAQYVDPGRKEVYSGRAVAYGYAEATEPGKLEVARSDGTPALVDTCLVSSRRGSLMMSFYDPDRMHAYMAAVMAIEEEHEGSKEGWRARGEDKTRVKNDVLTRFDGGKLKGLLTVVDKVDDWMLFPVYRLPPNGRWIRGRVILLGDAAHAMPPQGESTGVAIEDGVLLAHVFQRHATRSPSQLFHDYETLRRKTIDKLYKETVWRWENAAGGQSGWLWGIFMEWLTVVVLAMMNWRSENHFASDVSRLTLPP